MFPGPEQLSINLSRLVAKCAGIHHTNKKPPSLTRVGHSGSSQKGLHHLSINFLSRQPKLMFRLMTNSSSRLTGILFPTRRSSHLSLRMGNHLLRFCCCCLDSKRFHPGLSGSDNFRMLSVENMILSVPAEHERPYWCSDKLLKHRPDLRTKFNLALPPRRLFSLLYLDFEILQKPLFISHTQANMLKQGTKPIPCCAPIQISGLPSPQPLCRVTTSPPFQKP